MAQWLRRFAAEPKDARLISGAAAAFLMKAKGENAHVFEISDGAR